MVSAMTPAVETGSHSAPAVSSRIARSIPMAIASRSCSSAAAGPSVRTAVEPPSFSTMRTASSTPHSSCGLIVWPRNFVSIACPSAVSTMRPPVCGTRLTQTRMFTTRAISCANPRVLRVEEGRRAGDRDRHWILLAQVFDEELVADDRLTGREIRHQEVPADRRAGSRRGHVRTAAPPVDERLPVRGQDGLAPEHVALDAALRRRVVEAERAQHGDGRLRPLLDVRGLANEIGRFHRRSGHAGIDEVEVELELVAVGAVALLESGGHGVRADP